MEYKSSFSKNSSEMDIYAIVLYRDNESSIGKCISSLTFCFDKILLINTGSADSSNDIIDKKKSILMVKSSLNITLGLTTFPLQETSHYQK